MPYTVRKNGSRYCVYKVSGGDTLGCHDTKKEAVDQIAAIESNEKSSITPALARALNLEDYRSAKVNGLDFYVAESAEQRRSGLAGLARLDKAGMVFVYDKDVSHAYTMSGMEFDLDIAFYDAESALVALKTCPAGSGAVVSPAPYRVVVEAPAGTVDLSELDVSSFISGGAEV